MGVLTDFFVADAAELAKIFAGWHCVLDEPKRREVKNPFTKAVQEITEWLPGDLIAEGPATNAPNICVLPCAEFKRIDPIKLSILRHLLISADIDKSIQILSKPALLHPATEEIGLHEIPSDLVMSLAAIEDDVLAVTAENWQQTNELRRDHFQMADCISILKELRRLSRLARDSNRRMYLFWSL